MKSDKWWIIVHGDGDGIVSGAIALNYLEGEKEVYFSHPAGLSTDLDIVRAGDNVFVADIAISSGTEDRLINALKRIANSGGRIIYVDHHPIPKDFTLESIPVTMIHDECCSASELVFKYFNQNLSEENTLSDIERVALYGAISDYLDTTPWAKRALDKWDKRFIYFEAGLLAQGLEGLKKQHELKRKIVLNLYKGILPSEIPELVVNSIFTSSNERNLIAYIKSNLREIDCIAYVIEPPGSFTRAATYARTIGNKKVGISIEIREKMAIMSIRSDGTNIVEAVMNIAPKYGGNGGGHKSACGARVPLTFLDSFLKDLYKEVCKK